MRGGCQRSAKREALLGVIETVPMSCSQCPNGYRLDRRAGTSNGCARSPDSPRGKTWTTWATAQTLESEVLFILIAERYERRSLGITSNLVYSEWERLRQPHGHRRSHRPGGPPHHYPRVRRPQLPHRCGPAAGSGTEGESQSPVNRHPPTLLFLRRPAVHPGAPLSLRPTACSLPDSFFPGRERVIN